MMMFVLDGNQKPESAPEKSLSTRAWLKEEVKLIRRLPRDVPNIARSMKYLFPNLSLREPAGNCTRA